jgi:lipopolysaccharide export LptBFGC system permease protein LptF
MEPAERLAQVVVKLAFIVLALIVSLVFDEFGHGVLGLVVFVVGLAFGAIALKMWKTL